MSGNTIAAIATPVAEGALGVIRISGDEAIRVADKVFFAFSGKKLQELKGYTAAYGEIKDGDIVLDDAVALVFRTPHSFTGENSVEITIHGGAVLLRSVLRLILKNGARLAKPGEFSERAFLNGKTDLTKAESIMGLISSKSEAELRLFREAHNGKIGNKIAEVEAYLLEIGASIAAYSDYPDEDIENLEPETFKKMLKKQKAELEKILSDYDLGKVLREGIDTAIVGKPNVGKSALMNMLSGSDRSIVTEIAGTTRDIIEETVRVGDIILKLSDTAGIHTTDDLVESIGVEKAKNKISSAQLILAVFDCSEPLDEDDKNLLSLTDKKNTIIVVNKTDKENKIDTCLFDGFCVVFTSAKNMQGYEDLEKAVNTITGVANLSEDSTILVNERQRLCVEKALDGVVEAINTLESGWTMDAVGICLDDAVAALLELTGKRVTNEITDEIFRRFCVGK